MTMHLNFAKLCAKYCWPFLGHRVLHLPYDKPKYVKNWSNCITWSVRKSNVHKTILTDVVLDRVTLSDLKSTLVTFGAFLKEYI